MEGKDVPESEWNNYMRKYSKEHKMYKDESDVWVLKCKYGNIQLHSLKDKKLVFSGEFKSPRGLTNFVKKLRMVKGLDAEITSEGDDNIQVVFGEDRLSLIAEVCAIRKKRHVQMTDERKQQLREQLQRAREQRVR